MDMHVFGLMPCIFLVALLRTTNLSEARRSPPGSHHESPEDSR